MDTWTHEQILSLAPDAQAAKSAQSLARPGKWQHLGRNDQALWGEQQGSGSAPYQVAVALSGPSFKCSCPSRKRPCKHALGLFLLAQAQPKAFPVGQPPEWLSGWLAKAEKPAQKVEKPAQAAPDPAAQARRAARRSSRVNQGIEALGQWLEDLVRQGLGTLPGQPAAFWENQAARLVDAQAPGLARRVRELAAIAGSGEGWPARALDRLARLHLLLEAYSRLDELPADLQAEIRSQVGWTQDQDELRSLAGRQGHWAVLDCQITEEDRLRTRRTWLWQAAECCAALILDFVPAGRPFEGGLAIGTGLEAELVFWPGPFPQRALIKAQGETRPLEALSGYPSIRAALDAYGVALASNPWLERLLMPIDGVIPLRQEQGWAICDGAGGLLPLLLPPVDGWRLVALSGGRPLTLVGEWDGSSLAAMGAWTGQELIPLGGQT